MSAPGSSHCSMQQGKKGVRPRLPLCTPQISLLSGQAKLTQGWEAFALRPQLQPQAPCLAPHLLGSADRPSLRAAAPVLFQIPPVCWPRMAGFLPQPPKNKAKFPLQTPLGCLSQFSNWFLISSQDHQTVQARKHFFLLFIFGLSIQCSIQGQDRPRDGKRSTRGEP